MAIKDCNLANLRFANRSIAVKFGLGINPTAKAVGFLPNLT